MRVTEDDLLEEIDKLKEAIEFALEWHHKREAINQPGLQHDVYIELLKVTHPEKVKYPKD